MALKVIGAGFGRTGTLSLKGALEQLGFDKCYHMLEVFNNEGHYARWVEIHHGAPADWDSLFQGYQAAVDWPSCNFWREQLAHYPDAKVILSLRDADSWHKSVMNTIHPSSYDAWAKAQAEAKETGVLSPAAEGAHRLAMDLIWQGKFDGRVSDADHAKAVFEAHNADVIASVPAEQLLVYRPGDGWEPLCEFLGMPVPEAPYPKVNSTEDFKKIRWRET